MSRNFRQSWYRAAKKARRSAFGGTVATQDEVEALSQKIAQHEADELAEFEEGFDEQLKKL